jgi:hypothetical protein
MHSFELIEAYRVGYKKLMKLLVAEFSYPVDYQLVLNHAPGHMFSRMIERNISPRRFTKTVRKTFEEKLCILLFEGINLQDIQRKRIAVRSKEHDTIVVFVIYREDNTIKLTPITVMPYSYRVNDETEILEL